MYSSKVNLLPPQEFEFVKAGLNRLGLHSMQEFRDSVYWRVKRQAYFKRHEYKCVVCPVRHGLELHHKTYERLGNERDEDLEYRCDAHHEAQHKKWTREALKARRPLKLRRKRTHSLLACILFGYG